MFLCYYLLYYNNLCCVKTSNIVLGLVTKIAVHFYTDFTSDLLSKYDYLRINMDFVAASVV